MAATGPLIGIRELRKAHGLTLDGLADRIEEQGIKRPHPESLSNIEKGNKRASQPLMSAWAKALGLHPLDVEQRYAPPSAVAS